MKSDEYQSVRSVFERTGTAMRLGSDEGRRGSSLGRQRGRFEAPSRPVPPIQARKSSEIGLEGSWRR